MPAAKKQSKSRKQDANEKLKWETAKQLGLDDDLASPGDQLTTREAGKIGGNMVKKLIRAGQEALSDTQSQPEK